MIAIGTGSGMLRRTLPGASAEDVEQEITVTARRTREKLEDTPILDALRSVEVYGFVDAATAAS